MQQNEFYAVNTPQQYPQNNPYQQQYSQYPLYPQGPQNTPNPDESKKGKGGKYFWCGLATGLVTALLIVGSVYLVNRLRISLPTPAYRA